MSSKYGFLFQDGDSRVNDPPSMAEESYIAGFREAARILAEHCHSTLNRNTLVYPLIYNYRHYLELRLKSVLSGLNFYITSNAALHDEDIKKLVFDSHNLDAIWGKIKFLKSQLDSDDRRCFFDPKLKIKKVDRAIKEMTAIDKGSFAFRYAYDKSGNPPIPEEIQYISVENFIIKMDEVAEILEAIDNMIAIGIGYKNEYEMELNQYLEF